LSGNSEFDAIVLGAGAAGLFCASVAGQRGRRVLVIDHAEKLGEKIRISGGGRCNFTNRDTRIENMLSLNPHFAKSALSRYTPKNFIDLVKSHRIGFHEKHRGQLFCNDSATQIVRMLLAECEKGAVQLCHPVVIEGVHREGSFWRVQTSVASFASRAVVVATGGLPVPAMGATAFGLELAKSFSLSVTPVRPGLVPLSLTSDDTAFLDALAGVSLPVRIGSGARGERYGRGEFDEDLLVTHKGLSGPAILQASSYWVEGEELEVNWLGHHDPASLLSERELGARSVEQALALALPERLAQGFAQKLGLAGRRWAELGRADRQRVQHVLVAWRVKPAGTLGWKKAEVMVGGVDTDELESKTMMAKRQPGLYFIGECVDVTGHLGGHNFQWAWASAYACASSLP